MIATLAIFGLVIDHAVFDLHLSDAEIALEVRASSCASHRQNSMLEKIESDAGVWR